MWRYRRTIIGVIGLATLACVIGQDCSGPTFPVLDERNAQADEEADVVLALPYSDVETPPDPDALAPPCPGDEPPEPALAGPPPEGSPEAGRLQARPGGQTGQGQPPPQGPHETGPRPPCQEPPCEEPPCDPLPQDVPPEEIAEHCINRMTRMANRCVQDNEDLAGMCVCRITELLDEGLEEEAIGLARRCVRRVHHRSVECGKTIGCTCRRCSKAIRLAGGDETLLEEVQAVCEEQIQRVKASHETAVQAIKDAVGVDLDEEPPEDRTGEEG